MTWGYVSWLRRNRWSAKHIVVGADTGPPSDCAGYYTLCGRVIPEDADEYADEPKALFRSVDRKFPLLALAVNGHQLGMYFVCGHCKRKMNMIEREKK